MMTKPVHGAGLYVKEILTAQATLTTTTGSIASQSGDFTIAHVPTGEGDGYYRITLPQSYTRIVSARCDIELPVANGGLFPAAKGSVIGLCQVGTLSASFQSQIPAVSGSAGVKAPPPNSSTLRFTVIAEKGFLR